MENFSHTHNVLNPEERDENKLPPMLNTLTNLTYIGCGLLSIASITNYFISCEKMDQLKNQKLTEIGGALGDFVNSSIELAMKECDQRLVVLVSSLASIIICFFGAMMMRGFKKQGFMVYTLGELIGPVSMMIILGSTYFGSIFMKIGLILPAIFIVLYATQRRYLTK